MVPPSAPDELTPVEEQAFSKEAEVTAAPHPSGDVILDVLSADDGLLGDLVRAYPGRALIETSSRWLEDWFERRSESIYVGEDCPPLQAASGDVVLKAVSAATRKALGVTLLSVEPHYFRGFRILADPISFSQGLTVIDGKNSSGKTSLAEALEWLLTGGLVRRSLRDLGNSRELENCVSNQLRPPEEDTWVEAVFALPDGTQSVFRRILVEDYGPISTKPCSSHLLHNGERLSDEEEVELLEELFVGSPPLLMQHTLRLFVHSEPGERRKYFERLLRLDELTTLIEKAVIGPARLAEFPSPGGSASLRRWEDLKKQLQSSRSKTAVRRVDKAELENVSDTFEAILPAVASEEFPTVVTAGATVAGARASVEEAQRAVRQQSFPLLDALRPKRAVDESFIAQFDGASFASRVTLLSEALDSLTRARQAAASIAEAQIAIANACAVLENAGLLPDAGVDATCPLCVYPTVPTLTVARIEEIHSWEPTRAALQEAEQRVATAGTRLHAWLRACVDARRRVIPGLIATADWESALKAVPGPVASAAREFRTEAERISANLKVFDATLVEVEAAIGDALREDRVTAELMRAHSTKLELLRRLLGTVIDRARDYASAVAALDAAVGSQAKEDAAYRRRDLWLAITDDVHGIASDIAWERAKVQVQGMLASAREALIAVRQEILDQRRQEFSDGMTQIWNTLRADRYSSFSQLSIPVPRGRGFPIEIEVKALLDDGATKKEVDALRVFSESQVHVLGIAAFITRCRLLGHRFVVLDDPVQSMDEEHFHTFANRLIPLLLGEGFQLILFTHNDTFARDVSFAQYERPDYATIKIRHARKTGCQIERDNRRVRERLRRAQEAAEKGDLDRAWLVVRLAIERFYTVTYLKYGPDSFRPASWADATADYMFSYVRPILEQHAPGSGARLKQILDMTASGAHDKASRGVTDVNLAVKDMGEIVTALEIVD